MVELYSRLVMKIVSRRLATIRARQREKNTSDTDRERERGQNQYTLSKC